MFKWLFKKEKKDTVIKSDDVRYICRGFRGYHKFEINNDNKDNVEDQNNSNNSNDELNTPASNY